MPLRLGTCFWFHAWTTPHPCSSSNDKWPFCASGISAPPFGSASPGCFIWIPLILILFYKLGADVWVRNPEVVFWFVLSGFVCLGIFYGIVRWSRRPGWENFRKNFEDNSAGRSVSRAEAVLDEIARFEEE